MTPIHTSVHATHSSHTGLSTLLGSQTRTRPHKTLTSNTRAVLPAKTSPSPRHPREEASPRPTPKKVTSKKTGRCVPSCGEVGHLFLCGEGAGGRKGPPKAVNLMSKNLKVTTGTGRVGGSRYPTSKSRGTFSLARAGTQSRAGKWGCQDAYGAPA